MYRGRYYYNFIYHSIIYKKPECERGFIFYNVCGNNFKNHNGRNSENYYVESFVHEIKTPISAISLACDNKEDKLIKKQIKKIDNIVEQMLFYARSDSVEKDYFVKKVLLEDVVHTAIMNYMDSLIQKKI